MDATTRLKLQLGELLWNNIVVGSELEASNNRVRELEAEIAASKPEPAKGDFGAKIGG